MKAELNENGVMCITPENSTEAYALTRWSADAWVMTNDMKRMENGHWRGSMVVVNKTKGGLGLRE